MFEMQIKSRKKEEFIEITDQIKSIVKEKNWTNGVLFLHTTHTTAGLTINENADPDVKSDILIALDKIIPNINFKHSEGNSDAHIKTSLMGTSLTLLVSDTKLVLGIWQGIYFCEFDGPRNRKIVIQFIKS